MKSGSQVYVSITGLRVRHWWQEFRFWRHAVASMRQARRCEGNLVAEARTINGIRHTLTVWETEAAMRRFLYRGAHQQAIRAFPGLATGKTFGYLTDTPPDWDQVHQMWQDRGVSYQAGAERSY